MKSMLKWGLLIVALTMFVGAARPAHAQCSNGVWTLNACTAGKIKCVSGKKSCLLGCYKKVAGKGVIDLLCLGKCRSKFDGAGIPAKSCFGKLEAKLGAACLTSGDTAAFEGKIDGFAASAVAMLLNGSSPITINKCLAGKVNSLIGYNKCRLGLLSGAAKKGVPPDALKLQGCRDKIKASYAKLDGPIDTPNACLTFGDVGTVVQADNLFIDDVIAELVAGQKDMNTQRCTGNTSVKCTSAPGGTAGCLVAGGTCEFYFGTALPLVAGGVATCVTNQWNGGISGTTNPTTGASAGTASVIAKIYNGISTNQPCPKCVGDSFPNDGTLGSGCAPPLGTCLGGDRNGLACDVNGVAPNPSFGSTSLDCPPLAGNLISTLPIDLTNANNATQAITLSALSPNCNATGFTGLKCACGSCSENAQKPCKSNADCTGTCTNVAGEPRKPNACLDDTSTAEAGCTDTGAVGDGEGTCPDGPVDQHCAINAHEGCTGLPTDCLSTPGDYCVAVNRPCYLDNGVVGGKIEAQGKFSAPINHYSHTTFGSVFCVAPTGSSAVNAAAGLPGAGRLELDGDAFDNGTASTCPTQSYLLPTSKGGVLDTGWTGLGHNATVPGQGKVTVAVSCPGGPPPASCGVCTYTGPVANANALP